MLSKSKTVSLNGTSIVTIQGEPRTVIAMNASVDGDLSVSINKYIHDRELYLAHKAEADADYDEFETFVYASLGGETNAK